MQGGGAIRTASILEHLARGHDVDVIVFRERGSPDPKGQFPSGLVREIVVLDMPYHRKDLVSRAMRNAGRAVRQVTPLVDRFGGFENEISAVVRNRRYQVTVVEHFWCAPYHEQLAPASEKTILDLHNIESILHERCSGTETGAQALLHGVFRRSARQLEQLWLPRYDTLLTASEHDAQLVRGISCHTDIRVYPNAIPLMPRPGMGERHMIAFSGNLAYHPNVAAVRYFQREIWPILSRRWPSLRWRLIGSHPEAVWNITNGDERIEFSGPIMNAVDELAACQVAVVPLLAGSGTRFKIIEAWAAGRAVVSTRIGAEGLQAEDGKHLLLAEDAPTFAEAVSRLLSSPDLRDQLGETGRALFESEFTWERAWRNLSL